MYLKKIISLLLLIHGGFVSYSQPTISGKYIYNSLYYNEEIELLSNGTFKYLLSSKFTKTEIDGNWQIRNDSLLILDSKPQMSQLLVIESLMKGSRVRINVRSMKNHYLNYNIYIIKSNGDTVVLKDQFNQTEVDFRFESFFLVNSLGLRSPTYKVNGTRTNFFTVYFNNRRVFENEPWLLYDDKIIPLGVDRIYANYNLIKIKSID